jgi:Kef-type K+ transport system membrane component KefB
MIPQPDVIGYVLADLALILLATGIAGRLAVALGQPRVVGEIVGGIAIGPTVLGGSVAVGGSEGAGLAAGLYPPEAFAVLSLVGQVGLVLFMFLVGLELDHRLLRGRGRQLGLLSMATGAAPIGLAFAAAPAFGGATWRPAGVGGTTFALFLGAGLAATALPVMARILQEKGLMSTPIGALSLGVAGLVTVVTFLAVAAASAGAVGSGADRIGTRLAWTVALVLLLSVVVRPALRLGLRRVDQRRHEDSILTALLVLALATGLAADRIGINALVGGFLLGLFVPAAPELSEAVRARLRDPVALFFFPVFLAVSGLVTDFRALDLDLLPGALLFLTLLVAGKWGPGYLAGRATGLARSEAHALGALLSCGGVLVLAVGLAGLQQGAITAELQVVFVVSALVTLVLVGPLIDRVLENERPRARL